MKQSSSLTPEDLCIKGSRTMPGWKLPAATKAKYCPQAVDLVYAADSQTTFDTYASCYNQVLVKVGTQ